MSPFQSTIGADTRSPVDDGYAMPATDLARALVAKGTIMVNEEIHQRELQLRVRLEVVHELRAVLLRQALPDRLPPFGILPAELLHCSL